MALTNKLTAIADAIREKTGETKTYTLDEMATAIGDITGGSGSGGGYITEENDYGTTIIIGEGGTGDQAQLNAPTIALSGRSIVITNGNNGSFQEGSKIVIDDEVAATITTNSYTIPYDTLSVGNHTAKVVATGENFTDSEASNTLAINKYSITVNATGCTQSAGNPTYITSGDVSINLNFELTDVINYTLDNEYFSINGATGSVISPIVAISNPTGNVTVTVVETENESIEYLPVGGIIFYIGTEENGATYSFYDENHARISNVNVGDSPSYYSVKGDSTSDKYYVLYPSAITSKCWTYKPSAAYYYNQEGTSLLFGKGKENTEIVMSKSYKSYDTIWKYLNNMNTNLTGGQSDWYIPSKGEAETLRTAIDGDGNSITTLFDNINIWTSSEAGAGNVWCWYKSKSAWNTNGNYSYNKGDVNSLLAIRSF